MYIIFSGLLFPELMADSLLWISTFICFICSAALPFPSDFGYKHAHSAGFAVVYDAPQWELAYLNHWPLLTAVLIVSLMLVLKHSSEFTA